jgi:hypothetical protein
MRQRWWWYRSKRAADISEESKVKKKKNKNKKKGSSRQSVVGYSRTDEEEIVLGSAICGCESASLNVVASCLKTMISLITVREK